jgi:hypothetical protein
MLRRFLALATAIAAVSCALLAMSRHGLILCLLNIVAGVACFRRGKGLLFIGLVGLAMYWSFGRGGAEETSEVSAYVATIRRFEDGDTIGERVHYVLANFYDGLTLWPLGRGLGAGQLGGVIAEGLSFQKMRILENEQGRILYEVGILGLFAVFFIRFLVLREELPALLREDSVPFRALYAASFPMILTSFLVNLAFNHTSSSMTWCVVALVFAAMRLRNAESPAAGAPRIHVARSS